MSLPVLFRKENTLKKFFVLLLLGFVTIISFGFNKTYAYSYTTYSYLLTSIFTYDSADTDEVYYSKKTDDGDYTLYFSASAPDIEDNFAILAGGYFDDLEVANWQNYNFTILWVYNDGYTYDPSALLFEVISHEELYSNIIGFKNFTREYIESYCHVVFNDTAYVAQNTLDTATSGLYDEGFEDGLDSNFGYISGYEAGRYEFGYYDSAWYTADERYTTGLNYGYGTGQADIHDNGSTQAGLSVGDSYDYDIGYDMGQDDMYDHGSDAYGTYDPVSSFDYGAGLTAGAASKEVDLMNLGYLMQGFFRTFNVLSIQILPNITIGMIIGVPLMLGLLSFIIGVATFTVSSSTRSNMKGRKKK